MQHTYVHNLKTIVTVIYKCQYKKLNIEINVFDYDDYFV